MRGNSLSDRLSRLRALKSQRKAAGENYGETAGLSPDSGERRQEAESSRTVPFADALGKAGWSRLEEFVWKRSTTVPVGIPPDPKSMLLRTENLDPCSLVFFDTETTGLSGGAGNCIFLCGFGRLEPDAPPPGVSRASGFHLRVDQYFLADFPGENAYLGILKDLFSPENILVSFNGKAFDCSLLRTRFIMNGLRAEWSRHLDLLYSSRMLWKNHLESCSLSVIERDILSIKRIDDVPGSLVPDIYFRFLKTGDTGRLLGVFQHNLTDITSLLTLFVRIEKFLSAPYPGPGMNLHQVGRFLLSRDPELGEHYLRECFISGDAVSGRYLAAHLRRTGNFGDAALVWEQLFTVHGSIHAAVELAKLFEHRIRDLSKALDTVNRVFDKPKMFWNDREESLLFRKARILRKIERGASGSGESSEAAV